MKNTAAQFKTLREALSLSISDTAHLFSVEPRTIRYWESGKSRIPQKVFDELVDIDRGMDLAATTYASKVFKSGRKTTTLKRYADPDEMREHSEGFELLPVSTHAAQLYRIQKRLRELGITAAIE